MSGQLSQEKLFKIILAPVQTEKSTALSQYGQYAFRVKNDATKIDVKRAVEMIFNVTVDVVRICNTHEKVKRFGQIIGRRKGWKKAYVTLGKDQVIKFAGA